MLQKQCHYPPTRVKELLCTTIESAGFISADCVEKGKLPEEMPGSTYNNTLARLAEQRITYYNRAARDGRLM